MRLIEKLNKALESPLPAGLRHYCEWQMLVILLFILFGDSFKFGRLLGITEYNWIQGHFADIGLTAQCSTAMYYLFGNKRKSIPPILLFPPAVFSLYELSQFPYHDYTDIICYFAGSAIALSSVSLYKHRLKMTKTVSKRG